MGRVICHPNESDGSASALPCIAKEPIEDDSANYIIPLDAKKESAIGPQKAAQPHFFQNSLDLTPVGNRVGSPFGSHDSKATRDAGKAKPG